MSHCIELGLLFIGVVKWGWNLSENTWRRINTLSHTIVYLQLYLKTAIRGCPKVLPFLKKASFNHPMPSLLRFRHGKFSFSSHWNKKKTIFGNPTMPCTKWVSFPLQRHQCWGSVLQTVDARVNPPFSFSLHCWICPRCFPWHRW